MVRNNSNWVILRLWLVLTLGWSFENIKLVSYINCGAPIRVSWFYVGSIKNYICKEYESLVTKLDELNDDELNSVTGGVFMRPLGDRVAIKVTGEEE